MTTKKKQRRFDSRFKARVALDAAKEQETIADVARKHGVHPVQAGQWKKQLVENAEAVFEGTPGEDWERREAELLKKIGELTVERDFLARGLRRLS